MLPGVDVLWGMGYGGVVVVVMFMVVLVLLVVRGSVMMVGGGRVVVLEWDGGTGRVGMGGAGIGNWAGYCNRPLPVQYENKTVPVGLRVLLSGLYLYIDFSEQTFPDVYPPKPIRSVLQSTQGAA